MKSSVALAACIVAISAIPALAQGTGPVASQCATDIQNFCASKEHGAGQVRACLESNREKVSPDCRQALDTTGPGRGKGARK